LFFFRALYSGIFNNNLSMENKDLNFIGKPQAVRLWDVFFLGPFLIYGGAYKSNLPPIARLGLIISGGLTIWYNGRNYLYNRKVETSGESEERTPA
jgi:hypothetical protein